MNSTASTLLAIGTNVVAIGILAYGIYFQRHRRRDMLIAYLALNVGMMAVTLVLASASVAAGLGLGLFGVLSIIRLRSNSLTQEEVAYYFASLALGLIAGLRPDPWWVAPVVTMLIVAVMYVADHPRIYAQARHQTIVLDAAITDEADLRARLGLLLDARITRVFVTETDLVRDVTIVDVRYTVRAPVAEPSPAAPDDRIAGTPVTQPALVR